MVEEWMYASDAGSGQIVITLGANSGLWFGPSGTGYAPLFGARDTLSVDPSSRQITLTMPNGVQYVFNSITTSSSTAPRGSLVQITTPGGALLVTNYASSQLQYVLRKDSTGVFQERYDYSYLSGSDPNAGSLQQVTIRRSADSGASFSYFRRVTYTYYDGINETGNGSLGDLRTAKTELFDSGSSTWLQPLTWYYRYYVSGTTNGFIHGLKFSFTPDGLARLTAVLTPPTTYFTATDLQVQPYSAYYFQYDSSHKVTLETVGGITGTSADQTYTLSYGSYPGAPTDFNSWTVLTIQGYPDGTQKIVYSNQLGSPIISDLRSGTQKWVEYRQYDSQGRLVLQATPAAVGGYTVLGNSITPSLNSTGLIYLSDYFPTVGTGYDGFPKGQSLQNGSSSSAQVRILDYTYVAVTGLATGTSYAVATQTVYKTESSSGAGPVQTSYSYAVQSSPQGLLRTTSLPNTGSQNGTNSNQVLEFYDANNNLVWRKDERGRLTYWNYDLKNNVVVQMIRDVNPTIVAPPSFMGAGTIINPLHLVTDYDYDTLGRLVRQRDPAVSDTSGSQIRTTTWTVYQDTAMQVWTTQGYVDSSGNAHVTSPSAPVTLTYMDSNGRVTDTIVAQRNSSATGALTAAETYMDQTKWARWTHNVYDDSAQLTETWLYFAIPQDASPTNPPDYGSEGTNYNKTIYGYDNRGRQYRVLTAGGTITKTDYDARSLVTQVSVGTDDSSGSSNNMKPVTINHYDNDTDQKNGLLTQVRQPVDDTASNDRVTNYAYDWRNRLLSTSGENGFFQLNYYDNLDRIYRVERYDTSASGNLIGRNETSYDDRNRVYQTTLYPVNISTGTVGTAVTAQTYHDESGNVLKQTNYGIAAWTKMTYDGIGRVVRTYYGYGSGPPTGVTVDVVMEQTQQGYDAAGNTILNIRWQRYDNEATSYTGVLGNTTTHPYAWLSGVASWYDQVNRPIASCDYGTGVPSPRPNPIPASSDTTLVSTTSYNARGEASQSADAYGKVSQHTFDDVGRLTQQINNLVSGGTQFDQNQTTNHTYNADGRLATLTAVNPTSGGGTGNQTTTYTYGVTLTGSAIASNDLLASVQYPASTPTVQFAYNRQRNVTQMTDENGTAHAYSYDLSGRLKVDAVTLASGTAIDGAIKRIERQYEIRGMLSGVTSYDSTTGGTIKNDVQLTYTDFAQLASDAQEHATAVGSGSPKVSYSYSYPRRTQVTYPSGQVANYNYLTGADDSLNRVSYISDGSLITLAQYSYLGAGRVVTVDYSQQPKVKYNVATGSTSATRYAGLDLFGRTATSYWQNYNTTTDLVKINYTYDRLNNRTSREDVVSKAQTPPVNLDELYSYDGLYRLDDLSRGTLSSGSITSPVFRQNWMNTALTATALDPTGNWTHFRQDNSNGGSSWSLDQTRAHNQANEITGITGGSWPTPPLYDAVGNTTSFPQPLALTSAYTAVYDAWNRLVKLSAGGTTVATYAYDGLNRRVSKTPYSSGVAGDTRHFYYSDSWQIVEERISSYASIPDRQFFWGIRYVDDLIVRDRDTDHNGTIDDRRYCLQDDNWNVMAICDISAIIYERMRYDAYGTLTLMGPAFTTPFGPDLTNWETFYAGYRWDSESGVYQVRNRYYHPALGRWITRDPIRYGGRDLNLYAYLANSPVTSSDTLGLYCARAKNCGPDVGQVVLAVLDDLVARYNASWLLWLSNDVRFLASVIPLPWDMHFAEVTAIFKGCPESDDCATCVTMFGFKQRYWDVNYALFGCLERLVGRSLWAAKQRAWEWKVLKWVTGSPWEWNTSVSSWIEAGYYYCSPERRPLSATAAKLEHDPRFDSCNICLDQSGEPAVVSRRMITYTIYAGLEAII
jgi:RHS repeat-associated protein